MGQSNLPRSSFRIWINAAYLLIGALVHASATAANASVPVWPPAPAEPKIAFVQSIYEPKDLGIKKGFFQRFGEIFTGSEHRRLIRPMSVLELDGVIYVGDPGAKAVHEFDTSHNRYQLIQLADHVPLPSPVGLAHDKRGRLYISDSVLSKILVVEKGEKVARVFELDTPLKQPTGIAISQETGNLFVVDTTSHQIKVFSETGKLLDTIGQRGDAGAGFNYPTMIWNSQDKKLLVTDSMNFRIQTISLGGEFLSAFGKLGNATGYLSRPKGVAADSEGFIYVVDSLFHALQIFDTEGRLMLSIGKQGTAAGEFWLPTGIYIARDQKIYVVDSQNQRVQVFRRLPEKSS